MAGRRLLLVHRVALLWVLLLLAMILHLLLVDRRRGLRLLPALIGDLALGKLRYLLLARMLIMDGRLRLLNVMSILRLVRGRSMERLVWRGGRLGRRSRRWLRLETLLRGVLVLALRLLKLIHLLDW